MHREINRDDMASVRMGDPMFVCALCNNICTYFVPFFNFCSIQLNGILGFLKQVKFICLKFFIGFYI